MLLITHGLGYKLTVQSGTCDCKNPLIHQRDRTPQPPYTKVLRSMTIPSSFSVTTVRIQYSDLL